MSWKGHPFAGEQWYRRNGRYSETRTVIDRTFGNGVVYVRGKVTRNSAQNPATVTEKEWFEWQKDALELKEN